MKRLLIFIGLMMMLGVPAAYGQTLVSEPALVVDGQIYAPTKISGPVHHYETPDVNPQQAFTQRHVWTGHGSDNLPCEGGIHWVDNENVLTISHCLESSTPSTTSSTTTSTTTSSTTSTTTTTTTIPASTTTTIPPTTTSSPSTTSTVPETSSTTTQATVPPTTTTISCQEDEDCWDCETMGNKVCGPTTTQPPTLPMTGLSLPLASLAIIGMGAVILGVSTLVGTRKR